jgi:hypothetical protein
MMVGPIIQVSAITLTGVVRRQRADVAGGKKVVPVNVSGPLMVNEVGPLLAACLGGQGIAQLLEL